MHILLFLILISQVAFATSFNLEDDLGSVINQGESIDVYLNLNNTDDIVLLQTEINYDSNILRLDQVILQPINTEVLNVTYPSNNAVKLDLLGGDLSIGQPILPLGTGRLVRLTFTAIGSGEVSLSPSNILAKTLTNQDVILNPAPQNLNISVFGTTFLLEDDLNQTVAKGATIDIYLKLNNVSDAVLLQTTISYDASILRLDQVILQPIRTEIMSVTYPSNNSVRLDILGGDLSIGQPILPLGSGRLVKMSFTALNEGQSLLSLANTIIRDLNNNDIVPYPQPQGSTIQVVAAPLIALSASNIDFSSVWVGQSHEIVLTMTNIGGAPMNNIATVISGGDFSLGASTCGTFLTAGASCNYTLSFHPSQLGIQNGQFTISSNAANSPQIVNLIGNGLAAIIQLNTNSLDFGSVRVGQNTTQDLFLTNAGNADMNNITVSTSGGDFRILQTTCGNILKAGMNCFYTLSFAPIKPGPQNENFMIIAGGAINSPQFVDLIGQGIAPLAVLDKGTLDFGAVAFNKTVDRNIILSNQGNADMSNIYAQINSNDFSIVSTDCSQQLGIQQSCTYTLRFHSQSPAGIKQAKFEVFSDADPVSANLIAESFILAGDADGDGDIDFSDVLLIFNYVGEANYPPAADFNGDGRVDYADVLAVFQEVL